MGPGSHNPSNWQQATLPDLETLKLILELAYRYEEQHGRMMTPAELLRALRHPGQ